MPHLSAEFLERDSIVSVLRELRKTGVSAERIDVYSDVPLEIPRSALDRRSHMSLRVVLGAIIFGLLTISFVYFAQHSYPIITGGMPIFSFWASGVVFYELTMLGAIVSSLFWFLYESGIFRRVRQTSPPTFEPGSICLRVQCNADQEEAVRKLLEDAGASHCRKVSNTQ